MNRDVFGGVFFNVRYADSAAPVYGATVLLARNNVEVGTYTTDQDGKTDTVFLESGEGYTALISAEGFFEKEFDLLPIKLDNILIQTAELFPKYSKSEGNAI